MAQPIWRWAMRKDANAGSSPKATVAMKRHHGYAMPTGRGWSINPPVRVATPHGHFLGLGPYRVEMLDLDAGEVTTLLESASHDYLAPQFDEDGTLYAIARPYEPGGRQSWWQTIKAALLFPWHVLLTLVMFLNMMSMLFRGRPAFDAPAAPGGPNPTAVMLWGRLLQAKRSARSGRKPPPPLAPADWQLISVQADGSQQPIADHVVAFDLCKKGLVYTDGYRVYFRHQDGEVCELCRGDMIEQLVALNQ